MFGSVQIMRWNQFSFCSKLCVNQQTRRYQRSRKNKTYQTEHWRLKRASPLFSHREFVFYSSTRISLHAPKNPVIRQDQVVGWAIQLKVTRKARLAAYAPLSRQPIARFSTALSYRNRLAVIPARVLRSTNEERCWRSGRADEEKMRFRLLERTKWMRRPLAKSRGFQLNKNRLHDDSATVVPRRWGKLSKNERIN